MAARASRLEWALRFSGASDTDSAMIVKDFKSLSDIACADTFDYLKAGETWQDLSSRAQAVETRFSVEAGVPTSKGGIILVQTLSNAELKYEDECQRPGLGELMQMTDGDFAAAMSKEQSDECTTIDTGEGGAGPSGTLTSNNASSVGKQIRACLDQMLDSLNVVDDCQENPLAGTTSPDTPPDKDKDKDKGGMHFTPGYPISCGWLSRRPRTCCTISE